MKTKEEVLRICSEELVELGEDALARRILAIARRKKLIVLRGPLVGAPAKEAYPIGELEAEYRREGYDNDWLEKGATKALIAKARKRGVRYLCNLRVRTWLPGCIGAKCRVSADAYT